MAVVVEHREAGEDTGSVADEGPVPPRVGTEHLQGVGDEIPLRQGDRHAVLEPGGVRQFAGLGRAWILAWTSGGRSRSRRNGTGSLMRRILSLG